MEGVPDPLLVVIGRTRHKMMLAEMAAACDQGAEFLELRLDFLSRAVDFSRLAEVKRCGWVATVRRPADGGRFPGKEAERLMILRQAIVSGHFEWVDLETDVIDSVPRYGKVKRIVSYHNLTETPGDLAAIYEAMCKQNADVVKIAVMVNRPDDCRRVIEIQRGATKPTVAFAMGELGFPTRLTALKFGAPWVYCSFNRERTFAPGLPTMDQLETVYRARAISRPTKVYALLGDPVSHSHGPALHNRLYAKRKDDAVYLPIRVAEGQVEEAVRAFAEVPIDGYSVTIPHKESAVALGSAGDDGVRRCQAANTVVREAGGVFTVYNTDGVAARASLEAALRDRKEGKTSLDRAFVLILGAGGAARAIAHALHAAGALVTITARTQERAARLAAEVGGKVIDWTGRSSVLPCDIVVNCTPIGMTPAVDQSPMHHSFFQPGVVAFDTVYTPENTKFIRDARERLSPVVTGVDMFVRQAALQIELFTGEPPSLDDLRAILRRAMSPLRTPTDDDQ